VEDGSGIIRVWGGLGRGEGVAYNQELAYDASQIESYQYGDIEQERKGVKMTKRGGKQ